MVNFVFKQRDRELRVAGYWKYEPTCESVCGEPVPLRILGHRRLRYGQSHVHGRKICSWFSLDVLLICSWFSLDSLLTHYWLSIDFVLIFNWFSIEFPLIFNWFSIDFLLTFNWFSIDFLFDCVHHNRIPPTCLGGMALTVLLVHLSPGPVYPVSRRFVAPTQVRIPLWFFPWFFYCFVRLRLGPVFTVVGSCSLPNACTASEVCKMINLGLKNDTFLYYKWWIMCQNQDPSHIASENALSVLACTGTASPLWASCTVHLLIRTHFDLNRFAAPEMCQIVYWNVWILQGTATPVGATCSGEGASTRQFCVHVFRWNLLNSVFMFSVEICWILCSCFPLKSVEFCVTNNEFCIKSDEFCIKFCIKLMKSAAMLTDEGCDRRA